LSSTVADRSSVVAPEDRLQQDIRDAQNAKSAATAAAATSTVARTTPAPTPAAAPKSTAVGGVTRPYTFNELIGKQGGLTALHFASRQGALHTVQALVEGGANVNQVSPADNTTPLVIATINGHFDTAKCTARSRRRIRRSRATPA
jgi:ankyrin repeat protein